VLALALLLALFEIRQKQIVDCPDTRSISAFSAENAPSPVAYLQSRAGELHGLRAAIGGECNASLTRCADLH
jgi:hypothetical protein